MRGEQDDALTHDVTPIAQLGPISLGDNNGVRELFGALPLHSVDRKYEIDAEHESLTINYLEVVGDIGVDDVWRDLIYNSVVSMASIPNLSDITYNFVGDGYSFTREEIEDVFGKRLPDLLASSGNGRPRFGPDWHLRNSASSSTHRRKEKPEECP